MGGFVLVVLLVGSVYVYTMLSVRQETFLEEIDEEVKQENEQKSEQKKS